MKKILSVTAILALACLQLSAQRSDVLLEKGWLFAKGDSSQWEEVSLPHDWAITGPFDMANDLQTVAVTQNGETEATLKTGRSGGLPYVGKGCYRTSFEVPAGKTAVLLFEGAMSRALVSVNGKEAIFWPYGYNSFWCDVTALLNTDGSANALEVSLENLPLSSRWYPGAGLYRPVHLITTDKVHVPVWGTHITTPHVEPAWASVCLETKIEGLEERSPVSVQTSILDASGAVVASSFNTLVLSHGLPFTQNFIVPNPALWSPESPSLYRAESVISLAGKVVDKYSTVFGIRSVEFVPGKGFMLNGEVRKFKGVCNHHDLGPLGAAVNESALRHQLEMLKDMGCDALRTTHNMPAPALVRLCDEMGIMTLVEPFDEWDMAKCDNGYHLYFEEWAERDMVNMLHQFRNSPSVVMWSIGNEVPTQCSPEGYKVAKFLQDICHREDPTRKCTCGMDQVDCILSNGFADLIDIPGLNYRTFRYEEAYAGLSQGFVLGSETASTVSSRGVYKIPAELGFGKMYADHQCSGYDTEACWWSNVPDIDFALADDYPWTLGQFVWTGFDYLGEPSPYDTDAWPNHSSMFGIIDLASLPKDRYYLYRSVWNSSEPTLHVLPHWNWKEGQNVPVFVYTSYPEAELFVNGVPQGRRAKASDVPATKGLQDEVQQLSRYRLMWNDVVYHKGEIKVVAYDAAGQPAMQKTVRTAGKPHHLQLTLSSGREALAPDGKDLAYVRVDVVDKEGVICPDAANLVEFRVSGAGSYKAAANGDPTCLDLFHLPRMHAFHGSLSAIVCSGTQPGDLVLTASAKGLKPASISISVR